MQINSVSVSAIFGHIDPAPILRIDHRTISKVPFMNRRTPHQLFSYEKRTPAADLHRCGSGLIGAGLNDRQLSK
jgi:hypothetical protein